MKRLAFSLAILISGQVTAGIPATPLMTLYKFNADPAMPYYAIDSFQKSGPSSPTGTLAQGTSVIPCLVIRNGKPLTDSGGTPFVGFEVVVDSRKATPAATEQFKSAFAQRRSMTVGNHHCPAGVKHVIDVRHLYAMEKAPFFDPPATGGLQDGRAGKGSQGERDEIVRAFHNSSLCEQANRSLIGRRSALERAWSRFVSDNPGHWSQEDLAQAKHLDYTMRTAIFEAHLDRGCNAYGACERNIIALSIRNRGRESCARKFGCDFPGDFQGVSSSVSQYNIWDEFLTQISGLTACYLRANLGSGEFAASGKASPKAEYYDKIRGIYEQNVASVERILFGGDRDLSEIFPRSSVSDLKALRHYYHAPAMGKCFPNNDRVEYMSGAVASKGEDFALIANTRIQVDRKVDDGYLFRDFIVKEEADRDATSLADNYPGFVIDGRKVSLKGASGCPPYGISPGCNFKQIGRYRKTPSWLSSGRPLEIQCQVSDRGEQCRGQGKPTTVGVGGKCDTQMRPVAGVP